MKGLVLGGVVLSAGASRRMGRPKALLELSGSTFLHRAVSLLQAAPCREIVVVCPPGKSAEYSIKVGPNGRVVENSRPERGMLSSLAIGLGTLSADVTHAMVTLVDTPLISDATAMGMAWHAAQHPHSILVAHHKGHPGHPVVYPRESWEPLTAWTGPQGARGFLAANAEEVFRVEVEDPGILRDFDRPQDLPPTD